MRYDYTIEFRDIWPETIIHRREGNVGPLPFIPPADSLVTLPNGNTYRTGRPQYVYRADGGVTIIIPCK